MFPGLSPRVLPPDHSVLCRYHLRLETEGFQRLFNHVMEQAWAQGLVSGRLYIIDTTHMIANAHLFRLKNEHQNGDDVSIPNRDAVGYYPPDEKLLAQHSLENHKEFIADLKKVYTASTESKVTHELANLRTNAARSTHW
jgi:hypothetical protein